MHIQSIPMWTGSSNNYAYLVVDDKSRDAVIIDPAHPEEVTPVLKPQVEAGEIKLTYIMNTHHHWDHAGGNSEMLTHFKYLPVIGGKDCQAVTRTPEHGEKFKIGQGCGRFFEGTPAEMHTALNKTLAALPNDTKVYPGHEYTKQNVKFLTTILQTEAVKGLESFAEKNKETQGQYTIGDEKSYNVFMMLDDPTVRKATGKTDPVDVMGALREMKNNM